MKRRNKLTAAIIAISVALALSNSAYGAVTKKPIKPKIQHPTLFKETPQLRANAIKALEIQWSIPDAFVLSNPEIMNLMIKAIGTFDPTKGKYSKGLSFPSWLFYFRQTIYFQSHASPGLLAQLVRVEKPCDYITAYNLSLIHI